MKQSEALSCVSSFTPLRWRKFLKQNRIEYDPDSEFPAEFVPALVLSDLVYKIPNLEPEQHELLFGFWIDGLNTHGPAGFLLGIIDSRFACCSGIEGWLDLQTGENIKKIPPMKSSTAFHFENIMRHVTEPKTERSGI